jgi:hypothetical protein
MVGAHPLVATYEHIFRLSPLRGEPNENILQDILPQRFAPLVFSIFTKAFLAFFYLFFTHIQLVKVVYLHFAKVNDLCFMYYNSSSSCNALLERKNVYLN